MIYISGVKEIMKIRENITPIGDGNHCLGFHRVPQNIYLIRENITPIGDGNLLVQNFHFLYSNKREYNSDRRRKLISHAA